MAAIRQLAQRDARVEAVHARHYHVENDAVGGLRLESIDSGRPVGGRCDAKAGHLERRAKQQPRARIVVDDEHRGGLIRIVVESIHRVLVAFRLRRPLFRAPARRRTRDIPPQFSAPAAPPPARCPRSARVRTP